MSVAAGDLSAARLAARRSTWRMRAIVKAAPSFAGIIAMAMLDVSSGALPASAAAAPDPRFAAFLAACLDGHRNPAVRSAAIAAAGFELVADDAHPMLGNLMRVSRKEIAAAKEEDGFTGTAAAFRKSADGSDFYLVTTALDMPETSEWKISLLGCYLYDFAAEAPLEPAIVTAHFDEEPVEAVDEDGLAGQTWNVEKIEGVWDVRNTFIAKGSPAAAKTGFSGLLLKITSTRE